MAARKRRKTGQQSIQTVESSDGISITKKEAARQQILAAIWMHFAQGQPVPICTLANAAHDICVSVIKAQGGSSTRDELEMMVRPEFRDSWRDLLKVPYNFFKHGSKSGEDALPERGVEVIPIAGHFGCEGDKESVRVFGGSRHPPAYSRDAKAQIIRPAR